MAEIFPFQAYRYDPSRVALQSVLTQPYDKITSAMQEGYYAASPYNLIAVEKGKSFPGDHPGSDVYSRAAETLQQWISQRVLIQDSAPAIYIYLQNYSVPGTHIHRQRLSFIALGRLEDYENGVIFRHERTLSAPKADRLELLRTTRTQTGQLFMLYDDPTCFLDRFCDQATRDTALADITDEYGVEHRLWTVTDPSQIRCFVSSMADKKLIIADGHHRYETALAYRNECRQRRGRPELAAACEMAMMTFVNIHSKGLTILPTHRLIRNLPAFRMQQWQRQLRPYFDWYAYPFSAAPERSEAWAEFHKDFERRGSAWHAIGVYGGPPAFYLFLLRKAADLDGLLPDVSADQRRLDVVLLHRIFLERGLGITADAVQREAHIVYEREPKAAIAAVDSKEVQLACLLHPVPVGQMARMALAGEVLPQKSTDFYPKLLSGLAIYRMD